MNLRPSIPWSFMLAAGLFLAALGSGCGSSGASSLTAPSGNDLEMSGNAGDYGADRDHGSRRGPGLPDGPALNSSLE